MIDSDSQSRQRHAPGRRRPELTPVQRALGLLTRREHSRKELARKLAVRGVDVEAARAAIDKLSGAGWQDDARFAELLVRSRANAGFGPLRIRAELASHELDGQVIASALADFDGDFGLNARELVRRRFGALLDPDHAPGVGPAAALRRKAAEFLARRGFSADQMHAATRLDPDQA